MALPEFTMRQLLEAGVHFGHQTQRWNPRMGEFIYGARNGIHIMDLTQTVPMLDAALNVIRDTVAKGGRLLFVGTKRQASSAIADSAEKCAQYYMNHRWLGGTLTNWKTVSLSINRLKSIDEQMETGIEGMTKKERLGMEREQNKLQASLGGIREMGGVPDLLFVIDVKKKPLPLLKPTNWAFLLWPSSIPTALQMALIISFRVMTMRRAQSGCIAILPAVQHLMACQRNLGPLELIWVPWKRHLLKKRLAQRPRQRQQTPLL